MAEHNGDYSPEAEYKRKQKREKVQRARIRQRIAEGRATNQDLVCIQEWERGALPWEEIMQAYTEVKAETSRAPASSGSPRTRKVSEPEEAGEVGSLKVLGWIGGGIAAFVGGLWLLGKYLNG